MLDVFSCKVEIRACQSTGRESIISEVMTLYTMFEQFGGLIYILLQEPAGDGRATWIGVLAAILLRFGAIRYRLSLPAFNTPGHI